MRGKKYLAKNISIMTISQFGSRILSFLLVPLYTNILTMGDYGTYDLFNTTITLLVPILTLGVSDAALRFPLDAEIDDKGVFTITIRRFLVSLSILCVPVIFNYFFTFSSVAKQFSFLLILMYCSHALSGICVNFARGIDCVKEVGISGILCSAVMLALNVLFLVSFHMGLWGYFLANSIAPLVQVGYLFVSLKLWRYLCLKEPYKDLQKNMLAYSIPLIANTTAWWVNNVSDRYVVTWLSGIVANGVYSVAYKIPSILSAVQGIFNQAWALSAVKDFDSKDSKGFFSDIYNLYNCAMVLVCSLLIVGTRLIARLMYAKEFYGAWAYVPWLLISVVFGALSGYLGGVFAAVKNTKVFAQTTIISAVVNIVLNILLVGYIGPIGAAFATLISYWVVFIIRIRVVKKYIDLNLNLLRDYSAYAVLVIQSVLLYIFNSDTFLFFCIESILLICLFFLFFKELRKITGMAFRRGRKVPK